MADYLYSDGNGNIYRLSGRKLSYEPVKTIDSSSGVYNGGPEWEAEITEDQLAGLLVMIETVFKNRTFRIEKRTIGSAEIRIYDGDQTSRVILAMRSPDKANIEKFLTGLK